MTQLTMFADSPPAQRHSATSRAAAEREPIASNASTSREAGEAIEQEPNTTVNERRLLAWLEERGNEGATDREIQEHFGWTGDYERPRRYRWSNAKQPRVVDSGRRRKTGRTDCIVWVVV